MGVFPTAFEDSDLSGLPTADPGSGLPYSLYGVLCVGAFGLDDRYSAVAHTHDGRYLQLSQADQPNGYPQLDDTGALVGTILHRTGTDAEIAAIVLAEGEFAYCTDTKETRVGDGVTAGGVLAGGGAKVYLGDSLSIANSTAFTTSATAPYLANSHYRVTVIVYVLDASITNNCKFLLSGTQNWRSPFSSPIITSPSRFLLWHSYYNDNATEWGMTMATGSGFSGTTNPNLNVTPAATGKQICRLLCQADIFTGPSAGSFLFGIAQKTANASALSAQALMTVERLG
ncbi:MAG: hypothetical protein ACTHK7_01875 [Aureliella sp.]